jgi:hypothetical protein
MQPPFLCNVDELGPYKPKNFEYGLESPCDIAKVVKMTNCDQILAWNRPKMPKFGQISTKNRYVQHIKA